jgi:RNA ligase (TIGR02306 family)
VRKLASVQVVNAVEPIPGADAIERLRVLGWWVVGKAGEFRPGDPVVYCEIDSLLPERPEFEFLRKSSFKPADPDSGRPAGFRIKTVKLRGQVSQGICFPLAVLPPGTPTAEGTDVTAALGVVKYEPPVPAGMTGKVRGPFPQWLPKTDETRVQVLEGVLARHRGRTFHLTEKLDGTSFTAFVTDDGFGVCSRNLWLDERDEASQLVRLARRLDLPERLKLLRDRLGVWPAVQGEVIGPGVQKNRYGLPALAVRVFSLLDTGTGRLVDREPALAALLGVGLTPVPQLGPLVLDHTVDELVALSVGVSQLNPKVQREGIVLRPEVEVEESEVGGRLSFKAINPLFLLKYDE